LIKYNKERRFPRGCCVVCTLTGHGLKDPDTAIGNSGKPINGAGEKGRRVEGDRHLAVAENLLDFGAADHERKHLLRGRYADSPKPADLGIDPNQAGFTR